LSPPRAAFPVVVPWIGYVTFDADTAGSSVLVFYEYTMIFSNLSGVNSTYSAVCLQQMKLKILALLSHIKGAVSKNPHPFFSLNSGRRGLDKERREPRGITSFLH